MSQPLAAAPIVHTPRIQAFRETLISQLPRAPNSARSRRVLEAMATNQLILAFLTWRLRTVPAKPRKVAIWSGGVAPSQLQAMAPRLAPLMRKVEAGDDLSPYLSHLVNTTGVVLPGAKATDQRGDIDMVLTREGLHHFHVPASDDPKDRSGPLVFAEVLETEFRLVAISDHGAFDRGSAERERFFAICQAYLAKDVPPNQGFMANPVLSSGHSLLVMSFANYCDEAMHRLDPKLDDPAFIDELYADPGQTRSLVRPKTPRLRWHFEDTQFGLLEAKAGVFFCFFPFLAR